MPEPVPHPPVGNDDLVRVADMPTALTSGTLEFGDGATQVFTLDGHTTYTDRGRTTQGDWWVIGDGRFGSFWPPDYKATYALHWIAEDGAITGLTFVETQRGTRFEGRYV